MIKTVSSKIPTTKTNRNVAKSFAIYPDMDEEARSDMRPRILIVEDNPADQALAMEAFKASKWKSAPHVVANGKEALEYLTDRSTEEKGEMPNLIILDLNLPGLDGRDLLLRIKKDPKLRFIPVVILSSSSAQADIQKCYELCANSYVQKPSGLDDFFAAIHDIEDYWFRRSSIPKFIQN